MTDQNVKCKAFYGQTKKSFAAVTRVDIREDSICENIHLKNAAGKRNAMECLSYCL